MKTFNFKNVLRKDDTKRMLRVTKQNANSLEANIEEVVDNVLEAGTPINAEVLSEFQNAILLAEENSSNAKTESNEAKNIATNSNSQSLEALNKAEEAIQTSNSAETKANEALTRVTQLQGTKVTVAGEYVPTFNADLKADQTSVNQLNTSLSSRISLVETNVANIKRTADTTTNLEGTIVITGTLVI